MLIWKQLQAKDNFTSQFRYYPPSTNPVWRIKQKRENEYIRRLQIQSEHFKLPKTYTTSLSISIFGNPYFCFLILNRHINRKAPFCLQHNSLVKLAKTTKTRFSSDQGTTVKISTSNYNKSKLIRIEVRKIDNDSPKWHLWIEIK